MQKRWHYLYVILYPSLGYKFYYGSRITKKHPDDDTDYFGSSVTFAHYNDDSDAAYQKDALKVILYAKHLYHTRKNTDNLNAAEAELIRAALNNAEYLGPDVCLNRNVRGQIYMTPEERQSAFERNLAIGHTFSSMPPAKRKKYARAGGRKAAQLKKGIHAMTAAQLKKARDRGNKRMAEKYAKTYVFCDPSGACVTIRNLRAFCRDNKLQAAHMRRVLNGIRKSHKGWTKP